MYVLCSFNQNTEEWSVWGWSIEEIPKKRAKRFIKCKLQKGEKAFVLPYWRFFSDKDSCKRYIPKII